MYPSAIVDFLKDLSRNSPLLYALAVVLSLAVQAVLIHWAIAFLLHLAARLGRRP